MKYIVDSMQFMPEYLQNLTLNLSRNNLGNNEKNIIYLANGMKKIPKYLKNLNIDLSHNNFGNNIQNMM